MRGEDDPSPTEALASRKVVYREVGTEGSEPAKSGTDEQKRHKRQLYPGKQPYSCKAPKGREGYRCRCRRDWRKEKALTGGGLRAYKLSEEKSAEVIVVVETSRTGERKSE